MVDILHRLHYTKQTHDDEEGDGCVSEGVGKIALAGRALEWRL